jgi:cell division protein ZapA
MDEQSITVIIADRPYKIIVPPQEKDNVMKAASIINTKLNEYTKTYSFKDKQDLLAMIVLQFATSNLKYEKSNVGINDISLEKLQEIEKQIDYFLEK